MEEIKILSLNTSARRGTVKHPVDAIHLNLSGIEGDAHAGKWHRQVSLLDIDSVNKMRKAAGREIGFGEFAENITTQGYPLINMHPLDMLVSGQVILEVTQIGKKCHGTNCAIFRETGDCVMPKEGIFVRVLSGGVVKEGDRIAVSTLSD